MPKQNPLATAVPEAISTSPVTEKPETKEEAEVQSNPMEEINRQRGEISVLRAKAEAKIMEGVVALQKLNKISKGAGKPTLLEFINLFAAMGAAINATAQEGQLSARVLTTAAFQHNIQSEAILSILKDKGIVEASEFEAAIDTIVAEQRAAAEKRKQETIQASIDQVKKPA